MLVEQLLQVSHKRLVTIADNAPMIQAAKLLCQGSDLVVVCSSAGLLTGVITKTDVVSQLSDCQGTSCTTAASLGCCCLPIRRFATGRLVENEGARFEEHSRHGSGLPAGRSAQCTRCAQGSSEGSRERGNVATRLCDGHRIPLIAHILAWRWRAD